MNKIVYLIRHGKIENPDNIVYGSNIEMHLSDEGREQLKRLASRIGQSGDIPSKIITSPLERAVDSSTILVKELGIASLEKDSDLKDSFVPAVAGKPVSFLHELYGKGTDEYSDEFTSQGNESREAIGNRMLHAFQRAIAQPDNCIALLSHGDPIFFLMYKLENPSVPIPTINRIGKIVDYLSKGHAWKLYVSENGKIVSKEMITPDEERK